MKIDSVATFTLGAITVLITFILLSSELCSQESVEHFINIMKDEKRQTWERMNAAKSLGQIDDNKGLSVLIQTLHGDKDFGVRSAAAESLGQIGAPIAVDPLLRSLVEEKSWVVRRSAAKSLGRFSDPRISKSLVATLERDDNPLVRAEAARSLGKLGDKSAIQTLKSALKDNGLVPNIGTNERIDRVSRVVVEAAAEALKGFGIEVDKNLLNFDWVEDVIRRLRDMSSEKGQRARAAWMLGLSQDKRAVKPLMKALREDKLRVQREAAKGLGLLGDKRAYDLLIQAMQSHPNRWLRNDAAKALGLLGDTRARAEIERALKEGKIRKGSAEKALKNLTK